MPAGSSCSIQSFQLQGQPAVRLDNGIIRAEVLPQLGGRIWNLWHLDSGTQWLWHRPRKKLARAKPGTTHDDAWLGGWEEVFPNESPGHFQGRDLPDHGE